MTNSSVACAIKLSQMRSTMRRRAVSGLTEDPSSGPEPVRSSSETPRDDDIVILILMKAGTSWMSRIYDETNTQDVAELIAYSECNGIELSGSAFR